MWKFLIIPLIILILLCIYVTFNFHKFNFIKKVENKSKALSWLIVE